jgi:hypothetical protein
MDASSIPRKVYATNSGKLSRPTRHIRFRSYKSPPNVALSGTPELGGQVPLLPFIKRGKGGKGGLFIKGKYLLLIERIRSCHYRTI